LATAGNSSGGGTVASSTVVPEHGGLPMLNYLLTHPELRLTPPETADLCAAFDLAISDLQENGGASAEPVNDDTRTAMAAAILDGWRAGERDCRRLGDLAVRVAAHVAAK
jgi:hypothetical protein